MCLAACEDQQNNVAMTTSRLPNRQTMLEWPDFCVVLQKIERSCRQPWKRVDLDKAYPSLCNTLIKKVNDDLAEKRILCIQNNCYAPIISNSMQIAVIYI